jgi:Domain of unknown function (DUF4262)
VTRRARYRVRIPDVLAPRRYRPGVRFRRKRAAEPGPGQPTTAEPTAVEPTAVEPTAVEPTAELPAGKDVTAEGVAAEEPAGAEPAGDGQDADEVLRDLRRVIDTFGWAVLHGGGTPGEPRYSYTVGLAAWEHSEVVVVGLPFPAAEKYLNLVGEAVRAGARFAAGTATTALTDADSPVVFLRVEETARLTVVEQLHGTVDALQLIWPDSTGRLPWQEGHRNPPGTQPLLGSRPDDAPAGA